MRINYVFTLVILLLIIAVQLILLVSFNSNSLPINRNNMSEKQKNAIQDYIDYSNIMISSANSNPSGSNPLTGEKGYFRPINQELYLNIIASSSSRNINNLYFYLYDPNPLVRQMSVSVIANIENERASRVLIGMIADSHPWVRSQVIVEINAMFSKSPFSHLKSNDYVNIRDEYTYAKQTTPNQLQEELVVWFQQNRPDLYAEEYNKSYPGR